MKLSALRLTAATGLVASSLAAFTLTTAAPASAEPADWCSSGAPAPCIESLSRGATPVAKDDATWQAELDVFESSPHVQIVYAVRRSGSLDMQASELAQPWTITLNTGTVVPRVVNSFGRHGSVTRSDDGSYHVTITAEPVLVSIDGCDFTVYPWPCHETSPGDEVRFSGTIDNWGAWEDVAQREAFYGVNFFSNVEVTSFPPGVQYDDATGIAAMRLDLAAPHYNEDGSTVATAHFEATLPNDFLRENFYIPSPTTLTPAGLAVAGTGGSSSVVLSKPTPESPMFVEVTNMTFPVATIAPSPRAARAVSDEAHIRKMKVRTGTVVPTRPTELKATRVKPSKAKIRYTLAKARGFKVTGYKARCVSPGGHVVSASLAGNASPIAVTGLRKGKPYTCKVRATSKAGPGPWSLGVKVPRRP